MRKIIVSQEKNLFTNSCVSGDEQILRSIARKWPLLPSDEMSNPDIITQHSSAVNDKEKEILLTSNRKIFAKSFLPIQFVLMIDEI